MPFHPWLQSSGLLEQRL